METTEKTGYNLFKNTLYSAGLTLAYFRKEPIPRFAYHMGVNWGICGFLYFGSREAFLSIKRQYNENINFTNSQNRDLDKLLCSTLAGGTSGAIVNGIFPFSLIGGTGQFIYTRFHRLRQRVILNSPPPSNDPTTKFKFNENPGIIESFVAFGKIIRIPPKEYQAMLEERNAKLKPLGAPRNYPEKVENVKEARKDKDKDKE
ncbi:hypothetical protein G9A89_020659 [Geosiphon pyriformis]|nr:hypothetical protein G9A89_020659 [Geosiphon pyriformis]